MFKSSLVNSCLSSDKCANIAALSLSIFAADLAYASSSFCAVLRSFSAAAAASIYSTSFVSNITVNSKSLFGVVPYNGKSSLQPPNIQHFTKLSVSTVYVILCTGRHIISCFCRLVYIDLYILSQGELPKSKGIFHKIPPAPSPPIFGVRPPPGAAPPGGTDRPLRRGRRGRCVLYHCAYAKGFSVG